MDIVVRTPEQIRQRLEWGGFFLRKVVENGVVLYARNEEMCVADVHVIGGPAPVSLDVMCSRIGRYLAGTEAVRAILFGSYARGEEDEASDLDLVIVESTNRPFVERGLAHLELFRLGVGLDLIVYTPEEYARLLADGNPFVERIEREGRVIHARSSG